LATNGLTHNVDKTSEFKLPDADLKKFEYLGYRFLLKAGKFEISPSAAKVAKYRTRMNAAFADYWREKPVNPRGAFRKLVGRVKFLTGNYPPFQQQVMRGYRNLLQQFDRNQLVELRSC
jgi:hypothetical protein